jgi:hypothetical protein
LGSHIIELQSLGRLKSIRELQSIGLLTIAEPRLYADVYAWKHCLERDICYPRMITLIGKNGYLKSSTALAGDGLEEHSKLEYIFEIIIMIIMITITD